ncbi:hypothetical protein [Bifidobacterium vespertilionis]|uniref:hypothetical protein n=1 Tax=Bifidobacterium vespertilionis TaxID=2562524 RepID=UPI001687BE90|nr:hypothetical protein [Bifidobacterium vespertilionis]
MNTEMNVQAAATGKIGRLPFLDLKRETARTLMMAERRRGGAQTNEGERPQNHETH